MDDQTKARLTALRAEYTQAREAAVAEANTLTAQYEAAHRAALARAHANQGAVEAVDAMLAWDTGALPPTEGAPTTRLPTDLLPAGEPATPGL